MSRKHKRRRRIEWQKRRFSRRRKVFRFVKPEPEEEPLEYSKEAEEFWIREALLNAPKAAD